MIRKDRYGLFTDTQKPFPEALDSLRRALADNGFGVLWEIDVQATMKKKLGVDVPEQVILGACNPPVAHQALQAEPAIGLLLPCNCTVRREGNRVILGAVSPHALLGLTGRNDLGPFADQVAAALEKILLEAR
jgi:uncharacterized protein (DUF302 family)